jgi:hypothetical protein
MFAIAFLLGSFAIDSSRAEDGLSVGVGGGALYSGLGVNVGRRGEHSFGYLAAGCSVGYSAADGWEVPCGVGAGWIWTDLLTKANDRHGLGVYVGPVRTRKTLDSDAKAVYGAGLTYVYFFGDGVAKGWNVGITPTVGKIYGNYRAGALINVGYQF